MTISETKEIYLFGDEESGADYLLESGVLEYHGLCLGDDFFPCTATGRVLLVVCRHKQQ